MDRFNIGAGYALCQMGESEWRRLANGEALFFSTRVPTQIPPKALDDWKAVFRKEIEFLREQYGDTPQRQRDLEKLESVSELRTMIRYDADTGELKTAYEALADDNPFIIDGSRYVYTEIALWKANTPFLELPRPETEPMLPANHPVLSRTLKEFHELGVDDDWFQWLSELMVQMAEATDAPLVAEYYPLQPSSLILQDWKSYRPRLPQDWYRFQPLLKAFGYRVRLSDAGWVVIESRSRDQARENDIPHPTLQRWLFKPNRRGILTLDECAEFAVLNWQQRSSLHFYIQSFAGLHDLLEGLFVPRELDFLHGGLLYAQNTLVYLTDDGAGTVPIPENGSVHALQLYASLKPAQRAQLRGAGIPFTQLDTAQQWRFLLASMRAMALVGLLWLGSAVPVSAQPSALTGEGWEARPRGGDGVQLRVSGALLSRGSWAQLAAPDWSQGYYSSQGTPPTAQLSGDTLTLRHAVSPDLGALTETLRKIAPDALEWRLEVEWRGEKPAIVEWCLGLWNADYLLGATLAGDGTLATTSLSREPRTLENDAIFAGRRFALDARLATVEVSSENLHVLDGRGGARWWSRETPTLWVGILRRELKQGEKVVLEARLRVQPKPLPAPAEPLTVSAPLQAIPDRWKPQPREPELIPPPKILWRDAGEPFRLPADRPARIVIEEDAYRPAADALARELQRYGVRAEVRTGTIDDPLLRVPPASRGNQVGAQLGFPAIIGNQVGGSPREAAETDPLLGSPREAGGTSRRGVITDQRHWCHLHRW
jgi:hypothetical protein